MSVLNYSLGLTFINITKILHLKTQFYLQFQFYYLVISQSYWRKFVCFVDYKKIDVVGMWLS